MIDVLSKRNMRIAAVIACGICAVKVIQAFNPQPDPPGFAMIGFTPESQYAVLNVSNVAIPGLSVGGTCQVQLSFSDGQGRTYKQEIVTLEQGKSASLPLMASDTPPTTVNTVDAVSNPRIELLPAVQRDGACFLTSSVEVVQTATGQTSAYATHASGGINHNETLVRDTESQ
jgi:hypothetical protein